jgi:hypothetical protein
MSTQLELGKCCWDGRAGLTALDSLHGILDLENVSIGTGLG